MMAPDFTMELVNCANIIDPYKSSLTEIILGPANSSMYFMQVS